MRLSIHPKFVQVPFENFVTFEFEKDEFNFKIKKYLTYPYLILQEVYVLRYCFINVSRYYQRRTAGVSGSLRIKEESNSHLSLSHGSSCGNDSI